MHVLGILILGELNLLRNEYMEFYPKELELNIRIFLTPEKCRNYGMAPERATTNVNGADMAEVMQTMRDMATAMAQQATATTLQAQTLAQKDAQRQQREEELATARGLAEFRRHNPPKFEGDHDPDKADLWLQEIEKFFEVLHCTGETKMEYATFLLTGEAECWWRGAKGIMQKNGEELTWEVFRQKFLDKYFPKSARAQKEAQFLSLYQGNMTVAEYAKSLNR